MTLPVGHNVAIYQLDDEHYLTERMDSGMLELWTLEQPWPDESSVCLPHIDLDGSPLYYIGRMH